MVPSFVVSFVPLFFAAAIGFYGGSGIGASQKETKVWVCILKGFLFHWVAVLLISIFYDLQGLAIPLLLSIIIALLRGLKCFCQSRADEKRIMRGLLYILHLLPLLCPLAFYLFGLNFCRLKGAFVAYPCGELFLLVGGFYYLAIGCGEIVRLLLIPLRPGIINGVCSDDAPAGWLIGILERSLFVVLILTGNIGIIGFVLAFKSLARFENLKEKAFAEYYLVGTMASSLLAIMMGLYLRFVMLSFYQGL